MRVEKHITLHLTGDECDTHSGAQQAEPVSSSSTGRLRRVDWLESCDHCRHQEGRHYCLRFDRVMKNMDTVKCDEWEAQPNNLSSPSGSA